MFRFLMKITAVLIMHKEKAVRYHTACIGVFDVKFNRASGELTVVKFSVLAALCHQRIVVADLLDVAVLHIKDHGGVADGGQTVRDNKARASLHQGSRCVPDLVGKLSAQLGAELCGDLTCDQRRNHIRLRMICHSSFSIIFQ